MQSGLLSRIKFARARKFVLALLAVLLVLTFNFFQESPHQIKAGISVSQDGQTITFGSGYYTVDSYGKIYTKTGNIANTPDEIYPFVSYLSEPYYYPGPTDHLSIQNENVKNVVVGNGANVLMEGNQTLNSLDVQTGGTVSQPQPDRSGNINRYQYSDQEWGMTFYGYLKVDDTQKRKLTCPTNYYTNPTTNQGNGCVISYSTTLNTDIFSLADWQNFDQIWQTSPTDFTSVRYNAPFSHYIDNTTGSTQYYPVRFKFKNDNRDERVEPMQVILRTDADAVVGSANGVDEDLIFGVTSSTGLVNTTAAEMNMSYYLLNQYVATPAQPKLGWILEDFSNAYQTYNNSNVDLTTFFSGYGEHTSGGGIFYLEYDDVTHAGAYSEALASTPFAKGTSAVFDQEVYRNYAFSAKTVNPNIAPSGTRYGPAGLQLSVNSELTISGGNIDVSGKGYPGYSYELRTEADGTAFESNRGGGVSNSGGLSTNRVPQSAAHAKPTNPDATSGTGGTGRYGDNTETGKNIYVYEESATNLNALGSGAGSASSGSTSPTHGGNGGGYISVNANTVRFTTTSGGIKANGSNGYQVGGGWNGSGGGSGGSVAIAATNLYYPKAKDPPSYFESKGGVGYDTATEIIPGNVDAPMSSGGGGGYIRITIENFYQNNVVDTGRDKIISTSHAEGGSISGYTDYSGGVGKLTVMFQPTAILNFPAVEKEVITHRYSDDGGSSPEYQYQIFPDDDAEIKLTVAGMADLSQYETVPTDIVIVSDISRSMNDDGKLAALKVAMKNLINSISLYNQITPDRIRLGLVNFQGGNPSDYCLENIDEFPMFAINCANAYTNGNPGDVGYDKFYMTSNPDDMAKLKIHIDEYDAKGGTPAGAGLNYARIMLSNHHARPLGSNAKKFIILVTDGAENLPTCITAPVNGPEIVYDDGVAGLSYCENSIRRFDGIPSAGEGTPIANYPLDAIEKAGIGLISIGTLLGGSGGYGSLPSGSSEYYKTFLSNISEYARPTYFNPASAYPVFYDVKTLPTLQPQLEDSLFNIINSPSAMPITVTETLPPGVVIQGNPIIGAYSDTGVLITPKEPFDACALSLDSSNRQTITCNIYPKNYGGGGYDNQNFKISIHTKATNVESGQFFDMDQNRLCVSGDENNMEMLDDQWNSYVKYSPAGPYTDMLQSKQITPTICKQFFSNSVRGDVFSSGDYLKNFAFYGRNLSQSSTGSTTGAGATWILPNYAFNSQAQASYSDNQRAYFDGRIALLEGEAKTLSTGDLSSNPTWNLQGVNINQADASEASSYPEGKVWRVVDGDLTLSGARSYRGKGTLIVSGNLTLESNATIVPSGSGDSLGVIVRGKTTFGGKNRVQFANFTIGNIEVNGSDVMAIGSFVAKNFTFGDNAKNRIRFYYDNRLDSVWPPGFRYFNMPTAKNAAP